MIIDARRGAADKGAETRHHSLLIGVHDVDPRHQPDCRNDQADDERTTAAETLRQRLAYLLLAAFQEFFKIGRRAAAGRTRAPRAASTPAGPSPAGLIVPRHWVFLSRVTTPPS